MNQLGFGTAYVDPMTKQQYENDITEIPYQMRSFYKSAGTRWNDLIKIGNFTNESTLLKTNIQAVIVPDGVRVREQSFLNADFGPNRGTDGECYAYLVEPLNPAKIGNDARVSKEYEEGKVKIYVQRTPTVRDSYPACGGFFIYSLNEKNIKKKNDNLSPN